MPDTHPTRNPFPRLGAMNLEGWRPQTKVRHPGWSTPTLSLPPLRRARTLVAAHLRDYTSTGDRLGRAVLIRGDYGSGKTHAVRDLVRWVRDCAEQGTDVEPPVQIGATANDTDFMHIVRQWMGDLSFDLITEVCRQYQGAVAVEQIADEELDEDTRRALRNTALVDRLFAEGRLEAGMVWDQQAREVPGGDGVREYRNAFGYLLGDDEKLQRAAHSWLIGKPLSEGQLRELGVDRTNGVPTRAWAAFSFIARLFRRAGRPLIVYVDQLEKLLLDADAETVDDNLTAFRSITGSLNREQGLLVVAAADEAWPVIPEDLRQRFGEDIVTMHALTVTETRQLISLYLHPEREPVPEPCDADLSPMTPDAVRAMLRFVGGNIRRTLQVASAAFERVLADGDVISAAVIEQVVREGALPYFDWESVRREVAQMLAERGLRFKGKAEVVGAEVDFAVPDEKAPLLVIKIREAIFHDDEAVGALESLNLVERLFEEGISARVVLVAAGYVSPEVMDHLRRFAHTVIVYNPERFKNEFGPVLDDAAHVSRAGTGQHQALDTDAFDDIRSSLAAIAESNADQVRALEERVTRLFERQAQARAADRREELVATWPDERLRLEKEIREARHKREERDLKELGDLREAAETRRVRRFLTPLVLAGAVPISGTGLLLYRDSLANALDPETGLMVISYWPFLIAVGVAIGLFATITYFWLSGRLLPGLASELRAPASSLRALEAAAHGYLRRRGRPLLHHYHPHLRYAAALDTGHEVGWEEVIDAMKAEPSAIVRAAMAKRLPPSNEHAIEVAMGETSRTVPEVAYAVERAEGLNTKGLPRRARLVARFGGGLKRIEPDGFLEEVVAELVGHEMMVSERAKSVARFHRGDMTLEDVRLGEIPEAWLRTAVRQLSPLEDSGLGALDGLPDINEIDRLFLTLSRLLYFAERGGFANAT